MMSHRVMLKVEELAIEIRFKRMKTIRIHIEPDGRVWVSAPIGTSMEKIERVLTPRLDYVRSKRAEILARPQTATAQPLERRTHRLLGVDYPLVLTPGGGSQARVALEDDHLCVTGNLVDHPELLRELLDQVQAKVLRRELARLMPLWEARMGRSASWWGVRRMKTRWGSCSTGSGRIRFSVNLGSQAPREIEYVVVHELAHLFVPNHSPAFWALVERHLPDWRIRKSTLNPNGELPDSEME